jgi:hypothetical protein
MGVVLSPSCLRISSPIPLAKNPRLRKNHATMTIMPALVLGKAFAMT